MWFATADALSFDSGRLSGRLHEKRRHDDDGYVWVERTDGFVWVLASLDLGGRLSPNEFIPVTAQRAADAMAAALRLPGVRQVRFSKAWPHPDREEHQGGTAVWYGAWPDDAWDQKLSEAAKLAEKKYGVEVNPGWPVVHGVPGSLTVAQWIGCLDTVTNVRHDI